MVSGSREEGQPLVRADEGGVAGPEEAEGGHARMRVAGFTAGAVVALTLLGLAASVGGGAGVGARLGAGWLQEDSKDLKHPKLVLPAYGAAQQRSVVNKEGGIPGLVDHVDELTDTTRFRLITFCNQAYWPFSHNMRESLKVVGPTLLPFWTIIVADKATKEFIQREAPEIDVFVDEDLESLVASSQSANLADLKQLLSWRRMHAIYGLVEADYTTVFLEPDVLFTKNPLQLFHDMLLDADIITTSDYGIGDAAVRQVNTKVIFAKPSEEAKKLLDVWQRAEPTYTGDDAEKGFLVNEILPNADKMEATIHVLDQTTVTNYLTHSADGTPTMVTGTGCDDVNYKLNFIDQLLRQVLPPPDGETSAPPMDYQSVLEGCDYTTRKEIQDQAEAGGGLAAAAATSGGGDSSYDDDSSGRSRGGGGGGGGGGSGGGGSEKSSGLDAKDIFG